MKDAHELRFYTTKEACEMLNLGRTYLYYCRKAGVLEATLIGRRVLYSHEQLAAFRRRLIEEGPRVHRLIQQLLRRGKRRR